jgi:hypothetical protein
VAYIEKLRAKVLESPENFEKHSGILSAFVSVLTRDLLAGKHLEGKE